VVRLVTPGTLTRRTLGGWKTCNQHYLLAILRGPAGWPEPPDPIGLAWIDIPLPN